MFIISNYRRGGGDPSPSQVLTSRNAHGSVTPAGTVMSNRINLSENAWEGQLCLYNEDPSEVLGSPAIAMYSF